MCACLCVCVANHALTVLDTINRSVVLWNVCLLTLGVDVCSHPNYALAVHTLTIPLHAHTLTVPLLFIS